MATPEIYLRGIQRSDQEQGFAEVGIDNAVRIAKLYGCRGPALDAFSAGIDKNLWEARRKNGLNAGMVGTIESALSAAAKNNGVNVGETEVRALSIGYVAASLAFKDLPIYINPAFRAESDATPEDGEILEMLEEFYAPVAEAHPEVIDGEISDATDVVDLNDRFALKLAEDALLMELERTHPESALTIIDQVEEAVIPELVEAPVPQDVIAETLTANALEYNYSYFTVD